ncbi:hypothetical protein [Cellulosilyticum sp. WCF-2]|uniref:hypothetical protein n=1 Tax=Cellulosilyticum sp. WCF-2 TaxID=2497860 RepID=UPI000F8E4C4A|nr:hypothetical protein [Cellulosilyticum sp. WCF-2]QEH67659.1 hypothetical protein EKH84_04320 [Cellulosilyticum sp. WCF-2]
MREDKNIRDELSKIIFNKRTQSLYPHIVIDIIFNEIEIKQEDIRISRDDLFFRFYLVAKKWVKTYKLNLAENSMVNQIIEKEVTQANSIEKINHSRIGDRVIKNVVSGKKLFLYSSDREQVVIDKKVVKEIKKDLAYWRQENLIAAKQLCLKYNEGKEDKVDEIFKDMTRIEVLHKNSKFTNPVS